MTSLDFLEIEFRTSSEQCLASLFQMGKANGVLCFATLCLLWLLVIRLLSFSGLIIAVISQGATVSAWPCSKVSFGQRA